MMPQSTKHDSPNPSSSPLPPPLPSSDHILYLPNSDHILYLRVQLGREEFSFGPYTCSPSDQAKATEKLRETVKAINNPCALSNLDKKIASAGHPFLINCSFGEVEAVPDQHVRNLSGDDIERNFEKRCVYTTIYQRNPVVAKLLNQLDKDATLTIYLVRWSSSYETKDGWKLHHSNSFLDLNKAKEHMKNSFQLDEEPSNSPVDLGDMTANWSVPSPSFVQKQWKAALITKFKATLGERKLVSFTMPDFTS